jgi:hypothetical protein
LFKTVCDLLEDAERALHNSRDDGRSAGGVVDISIQRAAGAVL